MARTHKKARRPSRYYLGFGLTALILGGMTLFLVLVVLPRRYVLSAGLRESGVSFPSEAVPFTPPEELLTQPPPPPPPRPAPVRGPAEVLWAEVGPLVEAGRFAQALPAFEEYLQTQPDDGDVLKEYAITLQRAGHQAEAVLVFDKILSLGNDPGIRLFLARALRDRSRVEEASVQYRILMDDDSTNADLALEWGQALAWSENYPRAAEVLLEGLKRDSASVDIKIALAQVYYWSDRLDDADRVLGTVHEEALAESGGLPLMREITAALTVPEPDPETEADPEIPLTPEEMILRARAEEDYQQAAALYAEALREVPADTSAWRAYADVLQFGLGDLEGAREALRSIESAGVNDPALQFRMAQLEVWTGRNDEASRRLQRLLAFLEGPLSGREGRQDMGFGTAETAEVRALLGDLQRWAGSRAISGDTYAQALLTDPYNARAIQGLAELETQVAEEVEDLEAPGVGGNAYSLTDSDEFTRLDLGVQGKTINDHWVWGFRTGTRWLGGFDLGGASREDQGLFLELESARWWRWGTVRTGVHFGVEEMGQGGTEVSFGGSLRFSDLGGFRTDIRFDHGPAYPLTMTLQSVRGGTTQDRFSLNMSRAIGRRWSLSLAGDVAWLKPGDLGVDGQDGSLRFEVGGSLGRSMSDQLILGVNARAAGYSDPSPVVDDLRLFWDPDAVLAWGVYGQWDQDLSDRWNVRARFNPSMAFIDERTARGFKAVPHLSAEAGLSFKTSRFLSTIDAFYYQGRFDGYRAYGLRLSMSARNWFRKEGEE